MVVVVVVVRCVVVVVEGVLLLRAVAFSRAPRPLAVDSRNCSCRFVVGG